MDAQGEIKKFLKMIIGWAPDIFKNVIAGIILQLITV